MATLSNLTINDTGHLQLPSGTAAQRPSASTAMIRNNSSRSEVEVYDGSKWTSALNLVPNIVTNGLLVNIDPGLPQSYSGTGSSITDLSGNGYTGTLIGSPTFGTNNNGIFTLNGSGQYMSFSSWGSFPTLGTIMFWMYSTSVTNYKNPFHSNYTGIANNIGIRFEQNTGGGFGVVVGNDSGTYTSSTYTSSLAANTWYHVVFVWSKTTNTYNGYLNGVLRFTTSNTYWATNLAYPVYGGGFDSSRLFVGSLSQLLYYNTEFTAQQVRQNFLATAGRFGVGTSVFPSLSPTIGTASATSSSAASVPFTAPSDNGGIAITSYTATSSPGGITGSSSSSPITVSGLSAVTSYTFTVTATNPAGTSLASSASNSITTQAAPGQAEYTTPGTYSWTAPTGVTSVCVVCIGGGGGGGNWNSGVQGGAGGGLGWKNNISVTPGASYTVVVGGGGSAGGDSVEGGNGGDSYFNSTGTVAGYGGTGGKNISNQGAFAPGSYTGDGGGSGGSAVLGSGGGSGGGGGAGGYNGSGGRGARNAAGGNGSYVATAGSGGAGGGGGGGATGGNNGGGGGGGTGIYGQGSDGAAGGDGTYVGAGGGGGSSGSAGQGGSSNAQAGPYGNTNRGGNGGSYGGGGGNSQASGTGAGGAVRIIWGSGRSFPSTRTANE